ncbi:alginate export family protein [Sphingomonas sp. UYP23]
MTLAQPVQAQVEVQTQVQAREAWQPPTLTLTRYDEDWSKIADPDERTGHWTEAFKYIPLGNETFLVTGAEVRLRYEGNHGTGWGDAPEPNNAYLWMRFVPHADLHVGRFRAFVQPIVAYAVGVAPSAGPIDQTRVDLLQGFADIRIGDAATGDPAGVGVTLRAGRQQLSLGTERLVGTRYGPNVPLAFDGFRAIASVDGAVVNLLAVRPVQPGLGTFDDRRSRTKSLWGVYAQLPGLDLYYLGYRNSDAAFNGRSGSELRHSIGVRSYGTSGAWHWNTEAIGQFGRFAGGPISAWTLSTELGHRFVHAPLAPDAIFRFASISGDKQAGDKKLNTFNALFPKGKYFGDLSPVGPYNLVSANTLVNMDLSRTVSASAGAMSYWRFTTADGVYDIPGHLVRAAGGSTKRYIGKEAEASLAWQATPELQLSASLSAFDPGGFIKDTGSAKTITLVGLEFNFRF